MITEYGRLKWGEWDGMTADELDVAGYRETYNLFYTDPFQFPGAPGGETVRQVCDRGKAFLEDITGRPENAQKRILIVTHGCAVRGILNHLYDNPADFWQGMYRQTVLLIWFMSEKGE